MEKKDITIDTIAQDPPERPKLMSEEEKNNVLLEFEEEIKKLENRKKDLIFKLQDLTKKKLKGKGSLMKSKKLSCVKGHL